MSMDLIRHITETEHKAAEIREQAREEGKRILAAAGAESLQLVQQAEKEAKKQAEVILKHTQAAAEQHVRKVKEQARDECGRLRENAEKKLDQVAGEMMERIVRAYVDH